MDIKSCIIEFQAFRNNNDRFIVKELVILDLLTFVVYPFIFEAPFSYERLNAKAKKTNDWLTKYFHHLHWYDGYISYTNLNSIMFQFCKRFNRIYTRGTEKQKWIKRYTYDEVINVQVERGFLYNVGNICISSHNPKHAESHCALRNVYRVAQYLKNGGSAKTINTRESPIISTSLTRDVQEVTTDKDGSTVSGITC